MESNAARELLEAARKNEKQLMQLAQDIKSCLEKFGDTQSGPVQLYLMLQMIIHPIVMVSRSSNCSSKDLMAMIQDCVDKNTEFFDEIDKLPPKATSKVRSFVESIFKPSMN